MSGHWAEAKTGVITLPDDDPIVFTIFQDWLYGQGLKLNQGLELDPSQAADASLLLGLWIFGDKVQVPDFQNAAIEALRNRITNPPRHFKLKDIQFAFEHTADGSPLRKLIMDLYVWESSLDGSIGKFLDEAYPKPFITGVVKGYFHQFPRPGPRSIQNKRPYAVNAELYHVRKPDIVIS
ncbi:MAG: hypothetical protein Q9181_000278 [Wetmoreana brouardii]